MKKCPKCKLINPPKAEICDCGFCFEIGESIRFNGESAGMVKSNSSKGENFNIYLGGSVTNFILGIAGPGLYAFAYLSAFGFSWGVTSSSQHSPGKNIIFILVILVYLAFVFLINRILISLVKESLRLNYAFITIGIYLITLTIVTLTIYR